MADYVLALGLLAAPTALGLWLWRLAAGPSRSRGRTVGRMVVALAVALVIAGVGVYQLTKSRTFQLVGELVPRVETTEKVVALTLDDGPTPGYTEEALAVLAEYDVPATFYLTGAACEENPGLLEAIVDAGHELGNHTYSHRRLYFLSTSTVADEIERTDEVFRAAGYEGAITFRAPGCKRLLTALLYLSANDRTSVTWDLEPDSIGDIMNDADAMVRYTVEGAQPGSIVLMHVMYDAREASREALPRIIEELQAEGYRFVTVSELLALR